MPSLRTFLGRLFGARHYEAGGGGHRWATTPQIGSPNHAILTSHATVRQRARAAYANNAFLTAGVDNFAFALVGDGIMASSRHPDEAIAERLNEGFEAWTDGADADGRTDFYGLQFQVAVNMIVAGEVLSRFVVRQDAMELPLKLQLLDPEQMDAGDHREMAGNVRVRAGIEFDGASRRTGYHVYRERPGDYLAVSSETVRIPASEILHVFQGRFPGQLRGISALAPVLLRAQELDAFQDASLAKARLSATVTGFYEGLDPEHFALASREEAKKLLEAREVQPGMLHPLQSGASISFPPATDVGDQYAAHVKTELQAIAAGLGIPYHVLTGDLSDANYSSLRAGNKTFERRLSALQHGVLVHQFCRPVWDRFIRTSALTGAIDMASYQRDPAPFHAVSWIPPTLPSVDPQKEAEADIALIEARLKSRRQAMLERGYRPEQIEAQLAAEPSPPTITATEESSPDA